MTDTAKPDHWPIRHALVAHEESLDLLMVFFPPSGFTGDREGLVKALTQFRETCSQVIALIAPLAYRTAVEQQAEDELMTREQAAYIRHWAGVPHGVGADGK